MMLNIVEEDMIPEQMTEEKYSQSSVSAGFTTTNSTKHDGKYSPAPKIPESSKMQTLSLPC